MPRKFKSAEWAIVKGKRTPQKMKVFKQDPKEDTIVGLVNNNKQLESV